jgi:hypothetical protein
LGVSTLRSWAGWCLRCKGDGLTAVLGLFDADVGVLFTTAAGSDVARTPLNGVISLPFTFDLFEDLEVEDWFGIVAVVFLAG